MNNQNQRQQKLKQSLRNREQLFAAWVSYAHPSITETFAKAGFDFIAIDMEHSTISLNEGQRIIAACQSEGVPCLPRPVSHSNDYIKPLLESGADPKIRNRDCYNSFEYHLLRNNLDIANIIRNYSAAKTIQKSWRSFWFNKK